MSRQQRDREFGQHFAIIYIDREGNLHHETSPSISEYAQTILSPQVTSEFIKAVAESSHGGCPTFAPELSDSQPLNPPTPSLAPPVPGTARLGANLQSRRTSWSEAHTFDVQTATISVNNKGVLRQYYEKIFQNLQQTNCRVIAKAYVRLVEPRKQAQYPYNGRKTVAGKTRQFSPEETKPPWWPPGVSHREPDHLPKAERIRLLIHILCELRTSHRITAQKLKDAGRPVQQHISPIERLQLLDELYHVREEEENFLDAVTDGNARVAISQANLPDCMIIACRQYNSANMRSRVEQRLNCELPIQNLSICIRPTEAMVPSNGPVDPYFIVHASHQQDLIIEPGFNPSSPSLSPRNLKRRRSCLENRGFPTTRPTSTGYYSSFSDGLPFLIPHPLMNMTEFQQQEERISS